MQGIMPYMPTPVPVVSRIPTDKHQKGKTSNHYVQDEIAKCPVKEKCVADFI